MRNLTDLERAGGALRVTCKNCSHAASIKGRLLARRYGGAALMTTLKFSCTKCGGTNVRLAITTPDTAQLPHLAHGAAFGGHYAKFHDDD